MKVFLTFIRTNLLWGARTKPHAEQLKMPKEKNMGGKIDVFSDQEAQAGSDMVLQYVPASFLIRNERETCEMLWRG